MIGLPELRRALRPFSRRITGLVDRSVVVSVDEEAELQELQVDTGRSESHDRVKRFQPYGIASIPPRGSEAVLLFPGGYRSGGLAIGVTDRTTRLRLDEPGEVAVYNPESGAALVMLDDGTLKALGSLHVEGQLSDFRSSLEEMRLIFDTHVHPAPGSPTTTPMIPGSGGGSGEPESSFLEVGSGPPDPTLERVPGSYFADLDGGVVYERESDAWVQADLSLRGQTGDPGSVWYGTSGEPAQSLGRETDWHLDLATGDVRTKSTLGWVLLGNLQGPQGEQGATGPPGTTDHGALSDLLSDHHPQYLLADGARTASTLTVAGDIALGGLIDGRDPSVDGAKLDEFALGDTARQRLVWNANESRWDAELDRVKVQKVVASYVGPSGGVWAVQVLASEHGLGFDVEARAWDTSSVPGSRVAFDAHSLSINSSGDVTLEVSVSPDGRRDVLFVVSRTL